MEGRSSFRNKYMRQCACRARCSSTGLLSQQPGKSSAVIFERETMWGFGFGAGSCFACLVSNHVSAEWGWMGLLSWKSCAMKRQSGGWAEVVGLKLPSHYPTCRQCAHTHTCPRNHRSSPVLLPTETLWGGKRQQETASILIKWLGP